MVTLNGYNIGTRLIGRPNGDTEKGRLIEGEDIGSSWVGW